MQPTDRRMRALRQEVHAGPVLRRASMLATRSSWLATLAGNYVSSVATTHVAMIMEERGTLALAWALRCEGTP